MNKKPPIVLKDIWLVAYLRTRGIPLIGVERQGPILLFSFESSQGIEDLIRQFIDGTATVRVKDLRNNMRDLKSLMTGELPFAWANNGSQKAGEHAPVNRE